MSLRSFSSAMRTRSAPYSSRGPLIRDESLAQQQARRQRELKKIERSSKAYEAYLNECKGS